MGTSFRPRRPAAPTKTVAEAEELVRQMRAGQDKGINYRERSLKINGWICARCAREFELPTLHLLTVHHKDGNHNNNPADGSNWENLCSYCHDDEHGRGLLGDYLSDRKPRG